MKTSPSMSLIYCNLEEVALEKHFLSIVHDKMDAFGILFLHIVRAQFHQAGRRLKLLRTVEIAGFRVDQLVDLNNK